jgi:hypothetical protein
MRPRIDIQPRGSQHACRAWLHNDLFLEGESIPLASASAQERRSAVRAQSLAILHKVGCSWPARAQGLPATCSAGPTTPPRFEHIAGRPCARLSGEPTVSHEGCSGPRLPFQFFCSLQRDFPVIIKGLSRPFCRRQVAGIQPTARGLARIQSVRCRTCKLRVLREEFAKGLSRPFCRQVAGIQPSRGIQSVRRRVQVACIARSACLARDSGWCSAENAICLREFEMEQG